RNRQRLLECETTRDDFAKEVRHVVVGERTPVLAFDAREDFRFALRTIENRRFVARIRGFDLRNPLRAARALVDQTLQLAIDRGDARADIAQLHLFAAGVFRHQTCSASNTPMNSINASTAASGTAL